MARVKSEFEPGQGSVVQARRAWNRGNSVKEAPASWTPEGYRPSNAPKGSPSRLAFRLPCLLTWNTAPASHFAKSYPICLAQLVVRKCLDQRPVGKAAQVLTVLITGRDTAKSSPWRLHSQGESWSQRQRRGDVGSALPRPSTFHPHSCPGAGRAGCSPLIPQPCPYR